MGMFRRLIAIVFMGVALVSGTHIVLAQNPPNNQGSQTSYTQVFQGYRNALTPPPVTVTSGSGTGEDYIFPGCKRKYWEILNKSAEAAATSREAQWEAASAHSPIESSFTLFGDGNNGISPCNDIMTSFKNIGVSFNPSAILQGVLSNLLNHACNIGVDAVKKKLAELMKNKTARKFKQYGTYVFNPAEFFYLGINALDAETGPIQGLSFYQVNGLYPEVNGVPLNHFDQNTVPIPDRARIIFPQVRVGNQVVQPWPRSITCTSGADCIKNPY